MPLYFDKNCTKDSLNAAVNGIQKQLANTATKIDLDVMVSRLIAVENRLGEVEKTNIEIVPATNDALSLSDSTKDYIIANDIVKNAGIVGKSVTIKNAKVTGNAILTLSAEKEIALNSVELVGEYPTNSGSVVRINNGEYIVIRDAEFNAKSGYNLLEIGLSGNELPKSVLIENCRFTGKYKNNAILIFGTQDNAIININNCYFEDVSNCIRLANKTNAKNVVINITNCVCDKWDTADKWAGLILCQDYTSGSMEAEKVNNLFAPEKIIINISNLTVPGGNILMPPSNPSEICGTLDAKTQVIYVWNNKENSVPYSVDRYPKVNVM